MTALSAAITGGELAVEGAPVDRELPVGIPAPAYVFRVSCPRCGGELIHVAYGRPQAGTWSSAIAACEPCGAEFMVSATLRPRGRHGNGGTR